MTNPLAQVEIVELPDASRIARIIGEIDTSNAHLIASQLAEVADFSSTLTIDLTAVTYVDSQGMRILQGLADRHIQGSLSLTLVVEPANIVNKLLAIAGIGQSVPVRPPASPSVADEHGTGACS